MKDKLVFHYLEQERRYTLITKSGENVEKLVKKFIAKHNVNFPLLSKADYDNMWEHRTQINNLKNDIATARKQTTAVVINPLLDACRPLEKALEDVSDKLTERLVAFKPRAEKPKTKTIITIELPIESEETKKVKTYLKRSKIAYKEENK